MNTSPTPTPPPPPLPPKKTGVLPDAQFICYFLIGFTGFLFLSRPTTTKAQLAFRLILMLIGVAGLVIIKLRKKRAGN